MAGIKITCRRDKRKPGSDEALKKYIHEQIKTLWRDCVRAFLREAALHIHVDTGMSAASLYDAATEVKIAGEILADIMSNPNRSRPHAAYVDLRGGVHPGVKKSIALGQELGRAKKAHKILFGSPQQPNLLFQFNIVVYQYKLHERGWKGGEAWESLDRGKEAFLACWKENFNKRVKTSAILDFLLPKA